MDSSHRRWAGADFPRREGNWGGPVIADFPASEQPTSLVVAREVAASAAFLLLHPFGWRPERKRTPRRASQRTVVLVHGYGGNPGAFLPLAAYLRARGVPQLLRFDYPASDG